MVKNPRSWWPFLEATIFVGLAVAVNRNLFPDDPGFRDQPFSLFWIPIFLIAGRYGTVVSAYTGVLTSAVYLLQVSLDDLLLGRFSVGERDKVMLFAFTFLSLVLGQMFDRYRLRLQQLENDHQELQLQFENLRSHHDSLQLANTELEKRLIGRQSTFHSLYEMSRKLESTDESALKRGVMELLIRYLSSTKACLYLFDDRHALVPAFTNGYQEGDLPRLAARARENPLLQSALAAMGPISFRQGHESQMKRSDPVIMAAAIRPSPHEPPLGLLSIDEMPFLAVHAGNLRLLGIIADWTAQNLVKARTFTDLKTRELDDKLTGAYSYAFFRNRISEELNRAQRHRLHLTLMMLQIGNFSRMSEQSREDILSIIGLVFAHLIRDVDVACRYRDPQTFALILPLTDTAGALVLADKLRCNITNYRFKPFDHSDEELDVRISYRTFRAIEGDSRLYSINTVVAESFVAETEQALEDG